ncbi:MAG: WbqC family protein [Sulfuritalea sp.]|nr:WbqC family protein [Sulfuritalea sp.]
MKRIAIMQPYFFPYIGYFQLIQAVDQFVVYDNIKYTKKGWINRNRLLKEGEAALFSLPLKADSDFRDIRERELATDFSPDKFLDRIRGAYRRAPCFVETFPLIEQVVRHKDRNLFGFIHHSITATCSYLGIGTQIRISSTIDVDHGLKSQDKVLALCQAVGADTYINSIGGTDLYDQKDFAARGIELSFLQPRPIEYLQFGGEFVPWLSIIDVMMFNPKATVVAMLDRYDLI